MVPIAVAIRAIIGRADGKSQPQSGKPIEFSERAQDHHWTIGTQRDSADGRIDIGKGFIDDQPATTTFNS